MVQSFPKIAKTWVYQSNVVFTDSMKQLINQELELFVSVWEAHGTKLAAGFQIIDNQFIALIVDETGQHATGCSIDKSVSIIKKLENLLGVSLSDRSLVAYISDNQVKTIDFRKIKEIVQSGEITAQTLVYNLAITDFGQLETNFKIPAKDTWIAKFF
jgi:hypothetical protein